MSFPRRGCITRCHPELVSGSISFLRIKKYRFRIKSGMTKEDVISDKFQALIFMLFLISLFYNDREEC
ncbi:MAG: hypothetical protein AMK70_09400 [Nitrospira bacterium SG8_35_1]|nr:MAG: hypothetical protein AMK70_09400 [Nitrospira bacterium SG8_35_1]